MWKKVLLSIILVALAILAIYLLNNNKNKKEQENINNVNMIDNESERLSKYVTDECIDEWDDYALEVQEELKETSSILTEENKTYILRLENDFIEVYYLDDNNEEVLYKKTDICAKYLTDEDIENLINGIRVEGIENLNKLLEDFE